MEIFFTAAQLVVSLGWTEWDDLLVLLGFSLHEQGHRG